MVFYFGTNTRSNLELELQASEHSYFTSSDVKKAEKMAKEAVRRYHEELGIRDRSLWGQIKAFLHKE